MNPSSEPKCRPQQRTFGNDSAHQDETKAVGPDENLVALLAECRFALDDLLRKKPMLASMECGSTTLGNLRAMLHQYRGKAGPQSAG